MNLHKKSVLITDIDNTLFDWFGFWYHSFDAMLAKTSAISGVSRDTLIKEIKPIHEKYGTSEYSFLLEELPSLQKIYGGREGINEALDEAIHAFRSARKKYLTLYPTVMKSLYALKKQGCHIIAFTESKAYYAASRIKRLELDGIIDVLFSPADHDVPIQENNRAVILLEKTLHMFTPKNEIKPNPQLLLDIIDSINAKPIQCVYIGDSEMKDIEMAQAAGISDVFASYGTNHFEDFKEGYNLLRAVTHWTDEDVQKEKLIKEKVVRSSRPTNTVKVFEELLLLFDFVPFEVGKNGRP